MIVHWIHEGHTGTTEIDLASAERRRQEDDSLAIVVAADIARAITVDGLVTNDEIQICITEPSSLSGDYAVVRSPYEIRGRKGISFGAVQITARTDEERMAHADAVMRMIPEDQVDNAFKAILTYYGDHTMMGPELTEHQEVIVERLEKLYEDGVLHGVGRTVYSTLDDTVGVMVEAAINRGVEDPDEEARDAFRAETGHVFMIAGADAHNPVKAFCCYVRAEPEIDLEAVAAISRRINDAASMTPVRCPTP